MTLSRRAFLRTTAGALAALKLSSFAKPRDEATQIAITMDDPKPDNLAGVPGSEINRRILSALATARVQAALFVTGMRIDNAAGKALIEDWDAAGHEICNHTYSHLSYNSPEVGYENFAGDFLKDQPLIHEYRRFTRRFRFPFLKEGDTAEKRDRFRALLHERGYSIGHVTVDASDWYIDGRMRKRLEKDPSAGTAPYRDYYVAHIRDRARYYRQLARDVLGHDTRHTLLIHHNLLNALYLGDMMRALGEDGWRWVDASHAFRDPVFKREPKIVPAGESLVWALAKESRRFEDQLRYPGEDGEYEKAKMDALGL
jgi:peptidoglycan/xylan/chitin deacetylase (PgdA/CDA1 family)